MTSLRFRSAGEASTTLTSFRQVSWKTDGAVPLFLFAAFPVWWAAGLGELIWPAAGLWMTVALLRAGRASAPLSFALYIAFVVVVAASGMMLQEASNILSWSIRLAQYVSVGLIVPYVLTFRHVVDGRLVLRALGFFWLGIVAGGYLGLVLGDFSFASPFALILPAGVESNEFVGAVVNPSFADIETFLGYEIRRPKAPFTYTNEWGSAAGLLAPLVVLDAKHGIGLSKRTARISLALAIVPVIVSVNRGLWLSLAIAAAYAAVIFVGRGQGRAVLQLLIGALVILVFVALSPLGDLFVDRLNTGHSDAERSSLVVDTIAEIPSSPFIGFGGPRAVEQGGPPLGSHGQVWIVLFSHGALGALTYFGFLIAMYARTQRFNSEVGLWAHVVIFTSIVQALFYGHVPQQLAIVMAVIAIGLIDRHHPAAIGWSADTSTAAAN